MAEVELQDVTKRYGAGAIPAAENRRVAGGEFVNLFGPSWFGMGGRNCRCEPKG